MGVLRRFVVRALYGRWRGPLEVYLLDLLSLVYVPTPETGVLRNCYNNAAGFPLG